MPALKHAQRCCAILSASVDCDRTVRDAFVCWMCQMCQGICQPTSSWQLVTGQTSAQPLLLQPSNCAKYIFSLTHAAKHPAQPGVPLACCTTSTTGTSPLAAAAAARVNTYGSYIL